MPLIRAVLFDFGLVLSGPPDPSAQHRMETILNATHPDLQAAYWRHRSDYDLSHPLTDDELAQLLQADVDLWTQPNQPMIDWAAALQRAGISTGILSNMGDVMETGIIVRFPWIARFAHHTFSHHLGIAKPDERIYRHAIAGVGEPAVATLFIDDRIENIEAARAVGLHTIHYTTHDDFLRAFRGATFTGLPLPSPSIMSSTP
jgi:putative hydrolase of the HAD superfamily